MNCIEVQKLLSLYVDNMLESGQRAEIGAHLDECEACKQEYKELMGLVAMLNAIEDVPLPECFDRRLRAGF
ncbi:MAG: zf-HC2 domain-containing protein, partial [Anaerovorax sp.]